MYNKLLFGKDSTENIVSIECKDDKTILFLEKDGEVSQIEKPHKYWILSPDTYGSGWHKLKGNLYYQYGKQFTDFDTYLRHKLRLGKEDTFTIYNDKEATMVKDGVSYFKNMKPSDVSILAFDIETTSLNFTPEDKVLIIANTFRRNGIVSRKLFSYSDYNSQKEMLEDWCKYVQTCDPSILCGHNVYGFDFLYLEAAARYNDTSLTLGRDKSDIKFARYTSQFRKDGSQSYEYKKISCYGREIVDTFFLAIKYDIGRKYESYGLKSIIKQENMVVPDRVYYDADTIRFNYKDPVEWEKIKNYASFDGDEALMLFDLMIPSIFYFTQMIPKPFQSMLESATGSQLNAMMIRSYLQEGHSIPKPTESIKYDGAISFGEPGIYKDCWKIDIASLYPNIMLTYDIFDKEKDSEGNMMKILKILTEERLKNKKIAKETGDKYYDDLQNSAKVGINSMYGFMGASGLNFNYPIGAAEVTRHGRELLNRSINWAKNHCFNVINGDTDSITVTQNRFIPEEERKIKLLNLNEQFPYRIQFEDDGYYKTFVILKAKNYIMWDGEKLKVKGSALKSSTKEIAFKNFMNEIIQSIIDEKYNYLEIYNNYIHKIFSVKTKEEMKLFCSKKTITERTINSERTNETKIMEALGDANIQMGDKHYFFFTNDGSLSLVSNFNQNHDPYKLVEKLYKTVKTFETIIPIEQFPKYHLKTKRKLLVDIGIDL
jgi:DNA polymerase, archaea type